jgi:oligosaccharyl transferase complex subunit OST4
MISDGDLYRLAIFLGSCAMMMIVLYHFLDVNARDDNEPAENNSAKPARTTAKATTSSSEATPTSPPPTGKAL